MSSPISLFSGYSQSENRTTNYCLLLLRLLYEANPKFLEEALANITGGQMGAVGVDFSQQDRKANGIPDGVIRQLPFTIYIETKNFDWFYDDQLKRHLEDLSTEGSGLKVLLALSAFKDGHDSRFVEVKKLCKEEFGEDILFSALSFEEFIAAVQIDDLPKNLADHVSEFEDYLDRKDLLPDWKYQLDVCNCAQMIPEQRDHHVYICPAQKGAYSHQRSKYFGAYKDRAAQYLAEIAGVVEIAPGEDGRAEIQWNNRPDLYGDDALVEEARHRKMQTRPNIDYRARVFVLEDLTPAAFEKRRGGPMRSSKQYFDIRSLNVGSAPELVEALQGRAWHEFT